MKRLFYYVPAILFICIRLFSVLKGISVASPYWLIWPLLLILAGLMLQKGYYIKGAVLGLLPSLNWLYDGIMGAGSLLNADFLFGLFGTVFYIPAAFYSRKKANITRQNNLAEGDK